MIIGVPKEIKDNEARVGVTARRLISLRRERRVVCSVRGPGRPAADSRLRGAGGLPVRTGFAEAIAAQADADHRPGPQVPRLWRLLG